MRPAPLRSGLLLCLFLLACRDFSVPPPYEPEPTPLGFPCAADSECSVACVDGVCCQKRCEAAEACNLPGDKGVCKPRPPGAACEGSAQCPGGPCMHVALGDAGVVSFCCERACASFERCDLPASLGRCTARPPGASCSAPAECPSGLCVPKADGTSRFCCERACEEDERCDLPGHEGSCMPRGPGERCTADEQCASGPCVDGVCCESACEGDCVTCALAGSEGQCKPVPENTDPRDRCGQCGACTLAGFCGPATVGSNPKGECGDKVCSPSQTCGLPAGATCQASGECAEGGCVLSRCYSASLEPIFPKPQETPPSDVWILGLAADPDGRIALGLGSSYCHTTSGGAELCDWNEYSTLLKAAGDGGWTEAPKTRQELDQSRPDVVLGDVAFWGGQLYRAHYQACSGKPGCGLVGQLFSPTLEAGQREAINPESVAVGAAFLGVDGTERLWAAYSDMSRTGDEVLVVRRRDLQDGAAPAWTTVWTAPIVANAITQFWGARAVGGSFYLAKIGPGPGLKVYEAGLETPVAELALAGCEYSSLYDYFQVGSFDGPQGRGLTFAIRCGSQKHLVTWTKDAASPWETVALPGAAFGATPLRRAELPAFALYSSAQYLADALDVSIFWRTDPSVGWAEAPVYSSTPSLAAMYVSATSGADGAPLIGIATYLPSNEQQTTATGVAVLRYHR